VNTSQKLNHHQTVKAIAFIISSAMADIICPVFMDSAKRSARLPRIFMQPKDNRIRRFTVTKLARIIAKEKTS
jgi:hypothetical protein